LIIITAYILKGLQSVNCHS